MLHAEEIRWYNIPAGSRDYLYVVYLISVEGVTFDLTTFTTVLPVLVLSICSLVMLEGCSGCTGLSFLDMMSLSAPLEIEKVISEAVVFLVTFRLEGYRNVICVSSSW